MNILVRVKSKTFFCVQLRIDDNENKKRYYVGVNRRYENICVAYIHSAPMPQPLVAYMWPVDLQVKDLNLEAIRQALLRADDVNLRVLGSPHRITVRYEDLTAADDGNQDKAAISDASDIPWDLSRCVPNAVEAFHENNLLKGERRPPRKAISPRKRSRNGYMPEGYEADGGNEREEKGITWADEELMESRPIKSEPTFDMEELICWKPQRSCKVALTTISSTITPLPCVHAYALLLRIVVLVSPLVTKTN